MIYHCQNCGNITEIPDKDVLEHVERTPSLLKAIETILCRLRGRKGGKASMDSLTKAERLERALKAVEAKREKRRLCDKK